MVWCVFTFYIDLLTKPSECTCLNASPTLGEDLWLYPSKAMRGSVASHTAALAGFVPHACPACPTSSTHHVLFMFIYGYFTFWKNFVRRLFALINFVLLENLLYIAELFSG